VAAAAAAGVAATSMSNPSINKRQKEKNRKDKQRDKLIERERRKNERAQKGPLAPGEDPDIAGIVPGPQPPSDM